MSINKPLIFLADDDEDDRIFFSDALQELSVETEVKTFDNGVDLMASLLNRDLILPDLIFLDLFMPLMDGEECLTDIRDESNLAAIPVIMYSTSLDEEKIAVLKEKGADRYLQKPSSFTELVRALKCSIESISTQGSNVDNFVVRY